METFKIEVQELLSRTIDVEAHNTGDAIKKVNQMYSSEEIVLDYLDLSQQNIIPTFLINEKENLIKEIISLNRIDPGSLPYSMWQQSPLQISPAHRC